jgi:hypothetical protein
MQTAAQSLSPCRRGVGFSVSITVRRAFRGVRSAVGEPTLLLSRCSGESEPAVMSHTFPIIHHYNGLDSTLQVRVSVSRHDSLASTVCSQWSNLRIAKTMMAMQFT